MRQHARSSLGRSVFLHLSVALAICPSFYGQEAKIKILFINGSTGRPLKNMQVLVYEKGHSAEQMNFRTDFQGTVNFTAGHGTSLRAFSAAKKFIRSCEDGSFAGQHNFDVHTIVASGISEKSACKTPQLPAQPGMLIRILRQSSFIEMLGEN